MVSQNFHQAHLQELGLVQILGDQEFFDIFLTKQISRQIAQRFHNRFHDIFHDKQTPPSSSLELVEFETYYIKLNPPLFFCQQNMQWSRNMVHSHFTLCLRAT